MFNGTVPFICCAPGDLALPSSSERIIQMRVVGGSLFSLAVLVGVAQAGGRAVALVGAPPLLGMLLAGILLNNIPYVGTHLGQCCRQSC
jgi:hypothetical protein